jgi:GntR family transcriptional regulator/MocR family aminotransferase
MKSQPPGQLPPPDQTAAEPAAWTHAPKEAEVATLSVALDRSSSEPLVRQLYRALRELIMTRRLAPGARLPSTRKLSRDLQVSRTVTLDAFAQLGAEGFFESRRGSGHFVAPLKLLAENAEPRLASRPAEAEPSVWSPHGRPFDPAWQAVDVFPGQTWSRMLGRGWRRHQSQALERHWAGLPVLREALAGHLHALRGVPLSPDEIFITAGNSDAMSLVARSIGRGSRVWVEDPGYAASIRIFEREGLRIVRVPVDAEGLDVAAGERVAPDAAVALVTATRQFPLGMPLSLNRRLALLDWARRSGAIIVDDDFDGEIRFGGRPLQSLASLDGHARVLTVGSFSKVTFPGLRLGYIAGPSELVARLADARRGSQGLVPTGDQAALAEFITTGSFARHLRQLRTYLTRRRQILLDAIRKDLAGLAEVMDQQSGMLMTVKLSNALSQHTSDVAIATLARERGIVLMPLSEQYAAGGTAGFLLGYAGWDEPQLVAAIKAFVELLRELASQ